MILSLVLFVGFLAPAYAQTISEHVIINELDINPPGNDAASVSEWIEIYNPTDSDVDIGGWEIASTVGLKKTLTIPGGTVIGSGDFLIYSHQPIWFTDSGDSVELRDDTGIVVDKTPTLSDHQNDFASWQRIYDGYDLDSQYDWKFDTSNAGSSNGKQIESQKSRGVTVTVSSDPSYIFGQTAVISGTVSKEVFIYKPFFQSDSVVIDISGPNFVKTVRLYPDMNLNFETTIRLQQVLGVGEGTYDVSVIYADATADTSFSVGYELIEEVEKVDGLTDLLTDKPQYLPGEYVGITGTATDIIPFEGMAFTLKDPDDKVIASGTLFPVNDEFTTRVYMTTVDPVYGTYLIDAEYSDKSASTTFDLLEDIKEDVPISLWTDKTAYGLGDEVKITGRLNQVWVSTLDLEIIQTKQASIANSRSDTGFKILDGLTIDGDGSFAHTFTIPDNDLRLGDYRINVSKDIGSVSIVIHAVADPENFVAITEPLTIESDKESYDFGETMSLSGFVLDPHENSTYKTGSVVRITISHEDGTPLEIFALSNGAQNRSKNDQKVGYEFTAIPEISGRYSTQIDATHTVFTLGNYVAKAVYFTHSAITTFSITDPFDDLIDNATITLDKEIYGLGETVNLSGIVKPTSSNTVKISLTRPDGTGTDYGAYVDNQRFSWSWATPISEKYQNINVANIQDSLKSNFGVYKIKVSTDSEYVDLFFKVSADPENDSLSDSPIFVSAEKPLYKAGEKLKVIGNVILRSQNDEGLVIPDRVSIRIHDGVFPNKQIHEASVYPDQGGEFSSLFELPVTIFTDGSYIIKANYINARSQSTFGVANDFAFDLDGPVALLASTDKPEYYPGETVTISGKPNKLIYLEGYDVNIIQKTDTEINCGTFVCGMYADSTVNIRPSSSGSFTHEFVIPDETSAVGEYEVTVNADFEEKSLLFTVVEKPTYSKSKTVIEKENRIPETTISIPVAEKTVDDLAAVVAPRAISGSLITPLRADEPHVNLRVSTDTGLCIIGPDEGCLVSESTRKPGQIYESVLADGVALNVRYSGPDVRLEKFSILPESSEEFLPDAEWNVKVIKDDQASRFYYKVIYKTVQ